MEHYDRKSVDAWLIITDENGCLNDDCEELIILDDKEQIYGQNELRIVQNPVASTITLEANLPQVENLEYHLLDVTGKGVLSGKKAGQQQGTFNIEVENLATGMYYLYVAGEQKAITFKIVKN